MESRVDLRGRDSGEKDEEDPVAEITREERESKWENKKEMLLNKKEQRREL